MGQQKRNVVTAALLAMALMGNAATAQDVRVETVQFKPGETGATLNDSIRGDEIVDYVLNARAGQSIVVRMIPDNPSTYFNVLPPGSV
jgi:hypothetical protein